MDQNGDEQWVVRKGEYCVVEKAPCRTLDGIVTSDSFMAWHDMYLIKRGVKPGSMEPWIDCGKIYRDSNGQMVKKIDCDGKYNLFRYMSFDIQKNASDT